MNKEISFSVAGHAFRRKFVYVKNGSYSEMISPGGAAFIQQVLSHKKLAKYNLPDETFRCEHMELKWVEEKQSKKSYYAINHRMGVTDGNTVITQTAAPYTIVWDEGWGGLQAVQGPVLWASNKALPEKGLYKSIAHSCFLMLDADVLRNNGVMISRQVSWERAATELIRQMRNNPALSYLNKTPHILITFAEDGAIYINGEKRENGDSNACLVLTHGKGENFLKEKINGQISDTFPLMVAATAIQLPEVICQGKTLKILPVLKAAENLMETGYSIELLGSGAFDIPGEDSEHFRNCKSSFDIPAASDQNVDGSNFQCISNHASNKRIFNIAYEYVLKGAEIIEGLPQLSFGALTTIDRWEIESYQNIRNLILGYANTGSVRPLSIAVFGSPGSGKSFGVTQIAKNVLPDKVEKLEFNVSQFTDNTDLGTAFQKVRDVVLEGKLPLVFFDEFDSDRDGIPLGWIKNFLMPMQDGQFKDDSGEHPLGKCILVFAGGTSSSFEEFIRPMQSENKEEQQKFKNIKGPDFVSRLRGTINVLGPNPVNAGDENYILRRALLLRSLCGRKLKMKKGEAPINKNVLQAMLLVPKYKHGARSMEAILDMSNLENNVLEPASLPFYSQLSLHVDADAFIKLVLREVILNSYIEDLAKKIHENYLKTMLENGNEKHPSVVSWDDLTEEFKDSNRDQAQSIATKLHSVGYDYDAGDTPFLSIKEFDRATILSLAQEEHLRWMNEKLDKGWKYAPLKKDVDKETAIKDMRKEKLSHLLIDWENLDKEEQQKDIDAVKNIIPLLESIGLRVYKTI
ncbi:MAG: AAA family ATPase [Dysgonamonadaceae bacterium]|jgi:hypothetical protein|nr:AAA family ATPase [Dysgonamonadaceae bacterium]